MGSELSRIVAEVEDAGCSQVAQSLKSVRTKLSISADEIAEALGFETGGEYEEFEASYTAVSLPFDMALKVAKVLLRTGRADPEDFEAVLAGYMSADEIIGKLRDQQLTRSDEPAP